MHLLRSHRQTEPSAAQLAKLSEDGDRESVDCGWNTMPPALSLWPLITRTSSHDGKHHNLHRPLLDGRGGGEKVMAGAAGLLQDIP